LRSVHTEEQRPAIAATRKPGRFIIPLILALTLIIGVAILLNVWPMLLGGFGHRWIYEPPIAARIVRLAPGVLALLIYSAGLWVLRRRATPLFVLWAFLGAVVVPVSLMAVKGAPWVLLFNRTISTQATGAFAASTRIMDLQATYNSWLTDLPGFLDPLPHMSTSSPVWPTLYHLLGNLLARWPDLSNALALPLVQLQCQNFEFLNLGPARIAGVWPGVLAPVWAALTVVPMYGLARKVGDDRAARCAVAWWPLIPSLALFAATLSSFYPVVSTAAVLLFWHALHRPDLRQGYLWLAVTGIFTTAITLWNLSMLPLTLLMGLLTLIVWRSDHSHPRPAYWPLAVGASFGAGVLLVSGLYTLAFGHTPVDLFSAVMGVHIGLDRPYLPWLFLHPWDVFLYAGLPTVAIALYGGFRMSQGPARQLALGVGLTLAILTVTGSARGETGRVWMFLMPLIVIVAGCFMATVTRKQLWLLAGAQVLWLLVMNLVILSVRTRDVIPPPTYQEVAQLPASGPLVPVGADFNGEMRLAGYQAEQQPGSGNVTLTLHWQPLKGMVAPYYFSGVLVGPDGTVAPGQNWQPLGTRFPTTCWSSQEEVVDQVMLALPENASPGNWWLSLSAFAYREGQTPEPLPVVLADGTADHQVGLGPIEVAGP
jgi:hypothetical protein